MHALQFWKSWNKSHRIIFWILSLFVLSTIAFFWQGWSTSPAPTIAYDHFQQIHQIEVPSHSFQVGLINLVVPADSYLIFENIFGSKLQPNLVALSIFLSAFAISFLLFISIITTLTRYWFLIGMALVILMLASLRFDALAFLGITTRLLTIVVVLLFGGLAFYFHSLKKHAGFIQRLFSFFVLLVAIAFTVTYFSRVQVPLLHLGVNGLVTGIIVSIIFILMVSHEIVAAFLIIATQNIRPTKSLQHFLILTAVYLINLSLMFASKMGFISWNFFSINSFFILTVSSILGIWGFRQRRIVYEGILPEESLGVVFFVAMMLTSFATMGYFAASAGDMMMDAFDDLIMAAHLGCGLIFFFYVIANFGPMLVKNLPVYKILYKPETMPHFTFRLMSVIAVFAITSTAVPWKTYINQATASFYHGVGDLFLSQGEESVAEAFYMKSIQFRNQNLHAHYGLASIYRSRYESIQEKKEYEKSTVWTPTVPVYLNLSELYAAQGDLLQAALTVDEGKEKFPESGELLNAVGLSFMKLKISDSALYFFQLAEKHEATKEIGKTNFLGAAAFFNSGQPIDSILSLKNSAHDGRKVNTLALANQRQLHLIFEDQIEMDTALTVYQAALLCNYLVNQQKAADTAMISKVMKLANSYSNEGFKERLLVAAAQALYARGEVKRALQTLREVAYSSGEGRYFLLQGLWLLEQNNPLAASGYFMKANEKQQPSALYYLAIAEAEADSLNQALASWDTLSHSKEKTISAFATNLVQVLLGKSTQLNTLSDEQKYYFCRYKIDWQDSIGFEKAVGMIGDERLKAYAIVDRSKKLFALDEIEGASGLLRRTSAGTDKTLQREIDLLSVMIAAEKGDWNYIARKLNGWLEVPFNQRVYLEALQAEQQGHKNEASTRYHYLAEANNQFEEGIVAAARFFASDTTDRLKNFSLLVDGLLAKPNSIKILKQHVLQSIPLGLQQEAQDSLDKLQSLMRPKSFRKFIAEHPDYFGVENNSK